MKALSASHSLTALSATVSNTGFRSKAERLITSSTSAVAVCCCRDSPQLLGSCLNFVEQPRVLDRDHRLVGEGRNQLNLLLGKRLHDTAGQYDNADRGSLAQQRDAEDCPVTAVTRHAQGILGIRKGVGNVNCSPLKRDPPAHRATIGCEPDSA